MEHETQHPIIPTISFCQLLRRVLNPAHLVIREYLLLVTEHEADLLPGNILGRDHVRNARKFQRFAHIQASVGERHVKLENKITDFERNFFVLRDPGVCASAGDQNQEELPLCSGDVIAVHRLAGSVADGGAMHHGTPHRVLVTLFL